MASAELLSIHPYNLRQTTACKMFDDNGNLVNLQKAKESARADLDHLIEKTGDVPVDSEC